MPTTSPDRLLVTPQELADASLGALALDLLDAAERAVVCGAIAEAQGRLESYLDRVLLVHAVTDVPCYTYDRQYGRYMAYLSDWPLVETDDALITVVSGPARGAQKHVRTSLPTGSPPSISYFAGYRGSHHVLSGASGDQVNLTDLDGPDGPLADLGTLPDALPDTLAGVVTDLALVLLDERRTGLLGGKRKTSQAVGQTLITSEGYRANAEQEILEAAYAYRRVSL